MRNVEEFYILGEPIETEIGDCKFLLVKEFPNYASDLQIISLTKNHIINLYSEQYKTHPDLKDLIKEMSNYSHFEIVFGTPEFKDAYFNIFSKVFNEHVIEKITEDNFDTYRKLVMKMNCQKEELINPNPEIQAAIERSKRVKSQESEPLHFSDIVTSIVGHNGLTYRDINNFTIYQLYMTYYRISRIKNYDTSTLFATVSTEKIKIESWSKHINLFEEEKHSISLGKFNKNTKSIF